MPRRTLVLLLVSACAQGLLACGRGEDAEPRGFGNGAAALDGPAPYADEGASEAPAIPADAPKVLFLGDSIAAGLHLPASAAFPAVVQRLLAAEGAPFRLVNAGVSGDTSAGGLRRLDWLLAQEPDVLVVELGGNDGLRGQPVDDIEDRLREIVTRAQAAGARVLLLGVRLPPSLGGEYVREFEGLYARLADELDVAYVPFFMEGAAGEPARMLDDGIHPNAAGHERIAAKVAPALAELLGELAPR
jgi:acyl-CoA thioesterase-1